MVHNLYVLMITAGVVSLLFKIGFDETKSNKKGNKTQLRR